MERTFGITRRRFVLTSAAGLATLGLGGTGLLRFAVAADPLVLPPLPYPENALEPHISARTLSFHHGKHHAGYVKKANELLVGTGLEQAGLEEIVRRTAKDPARVALFQNAAQSYNHQFYWQSMKPGGSKPAGELAGRIERDFGSFDKLREQLIAAAGQRFGSGWVWLVEEQGQLKVVTTPNADTPLVEGARPLLVMDVWEHAYYLDYQNRRADYATAWVDHLASWSFAAANLGAPQR